MLKIKRVYEKADSGDGIRFLVDRLWPRGIKKEDPESVAGIVVISQPGAAKMVFA